MWNMEWHIYLNKCITFIAIPYEIILRVSIDNKLTLVHVVACCLAQNRQQAITRANDDPVHRCIYAPPGPLFTKRTLSYWYRDSHDKLETETVIRPSDHLRLITRIPIPIRWHLFSEQRPWAQLVNSLRPSDAYMCQWDKASLVT